MNTVMLVNMADDKGVCVNLVAKFNHLLLLFVTT